MLIDIERFALDLLQKGPAEPFLVGCLVIGRHDLAATIGLGGPPLPLDFAAEALRDPVGQVEIADIAQVPIGSRIFISTVEPGGLVAMGAQALL